MDCSHKVVLFGSVKSSDIVLNALLDAKINVVKVYSLYAEKPEEISGYYPIYKTAEKMGIEYGMFTKINADNIVKELREIEPDYIFVVGLSQIIGKEILDCAKQGVVGLHPAPLPKYRGRAALVWQMLQGETKSAVSLFLIDEGMDTGDILVQEEFPIKPDDYIYDADQRMLSALKTGAEKVAAMIRSGNITRIHQNHEEATYSLKRTPEDGKIDWNMPIEQIYRLIRAVSRPYPGAFSVYDKKFKIVFWRAEVLPNTKYIGIKGQICDLNDSYFDVLCSDGILRVTDYEVIGENKEEFKKLIVGHKFQ